MKSSGLHRFALLLSACTLLLVAAGATVTSKEAGLSVPDWPLSYGKVMPPMTGGVLFEHGHRMIATTVGLLTVVLAIWIWRVERRHWMKVLAGFAVFGVVLQGVLGGLTVLFLLPKPISISHACLAQLFFCTVVSIAVFTSPSWLRGPQIVEDSSWPPLRSLGVLVPALVLCQIALGAAFRHGAAGITPHIVGAMVVTGAILIVSMFVLSQFPAHRILRRCALALLLITGIQVLLGIGAYMARLSVGDAMRTPLAMVLPTVAHVAVGALTFGCSVVLAIEIFRNVRRASTFDIESEHVTAA